MSSPAGLTEITLALYAGLHREEALAHVAAQVIANAWHRPIAVVSAGRQQPEDALLFALFDLTEDHTGMMRRRARVVCEPSPNDGSKA